MRAIALEVVVLLLVLGDSVLVQVSGCNTDDAGSCLLEFSYAFAEAAEDDIYSYCSSVDDTIAELENCTNTALADCDESIKDIFVDQIPNLIAAVQQACSLVDDEDGIDMEGESGIDQCSIATGQCFGVIENLDQLVLGSDEGEEFRQKQHELCSALADVDLDRIKECLQQSNCADYNILGDEPNTTIITPSDIVDLLQELCQQDPTTDTNTGVLGDIISEIDKMYELIQGEISKQTVKAIVDKILEMDERVNQLSPEIQRILLIDLNLPIIGQYNELMQKLEFLLDYFMREIHLKKKEFVPVDISNEWADAVLSLNDEGIEKVLHKLHMLITGDNVFSPNSIIATVGTLLDTNFDMGPQFQMFAEFTLTLQATGYALLINALYIKDWDVKGIQELQANTIETQKEFLRWLDPMWPEGSWGLPMPSSGCPANLDFSWKYGYRYQDSEDNQNRNAWSIPNHFQSTGPDVKNYFCMKTDGGKRQWPAGDYCIYAKDGCPTGFSCGYIKWDDENSSNGNYHNGTLPDGTYNEDTLINFACRNDGSVDDEIVLPARMPFYLFRNVDMNCQKVKNTVVTMEWMKWDNEDSYNEDASSQPHPYENGGEHDHQLYYCYYEPTWNSTLS